MEHRDTFSWNNLYLLFYFILVAFVLGCLFRLKFSTAAFYPSIGHRTSPSDRKLPTPSYHSSVDRKRYQKLFFELHNLEDYSNALEPARDTLLEMLSRGISHGLENPPDTIMSISCYDAKRLWEFIEREQQKVMKQWRRYLERRQQGYEPELFATLATARTWLASHAPIKLVDGAWLAHVHKITTPFNLRGITKDTWQVFSEELGDGDISKHHVKLYQDLLAEVGLQFPVCDSAEFINMSQWDDLENTWAWEGAVGQLVISLFPHEFLPEILGFNMHYEQITLDTLRAAHELKPLGIDPKYFLLHVSIDNADSGHTAMATHTVIRYLDIVGSREGPEAVEGAWRRVQAGYAMSHDLGSHPDGPDDMACVADNMPATSIDPLTAQTINILKAKALVSHEYHRHTQARIAGRSLPEWLSPSAWAHQDASAHLRLVNELGRARPWVYAGDSSKSILVKELQWKGRMFGAFTEAEVTTLKAWIDSLSTRADTKPYWKYTLRKELSSMYALELLQDPIIHYPAIICNVSDDKEPWSSVELTQAEISRPLQEPWSPMHEFRFSSDPRLPELLVLWFAHIGLLENTITTPVRTANPLYANILLILRAQSGFLVETEVVAGMDELNRASSRSLVDIGLEILLNDKELSSCSSTCLNDIVDLAVAHGTSENCRSLAKDMLRWAQKPKQNIGWLLGLSIAIIPIKNAVAKSDHLLGKGSQIELKKIVERERECLLRCADLLKSVNELEYFQLLLGYRFCSAMLHSLHLRRG